MAYYPPKARTWHLRGDVSNIASYYRLVMLPQVVATEGTFTGASSSSTAVIIKAFSSDILGVNEIAAGTWRFALKAKVDSSTDITQIKIYAYSRDADGTETELFNVTSAEINDLTAASVIVTSAQSAFAVDVTDRLIIKFYALSNSGSAKTVTLYYQGATNYSTVSIPDDIPVREGDMTKDVYDQTGEALLNVNGVRFATDYEHGTPVTGQLDWNNEDGTIDVHLLNSSTNQLGQELSIYGKASAAIDNGAVVMYDGSKGKHIKIKTATSAVITAPHLILGVATQAIANNHFGYVTWFGKINDVFTPGWTASDVLYLDNSTGQLTNTAGAVVIVMGFVVKAATGAAENGVIAINPGFLAQGGGTTSTTHYEILQDSDGAILTDSGGIEILYTEVPN
jgi:hypothetical protein